MCLRALQGHSGLNFIDPSLKGQCDNSERIFSIMLTILAVCLIFIRPSTTDRYLEVRIQARDRQYSSCLLIPEDKGHQDPAQIDFTVQRRAKNLHSAWKNIKTRLLWFDI